MSCFPPYRQSCVIESGSRPFRTSTHRRKQLRSSDRSFWRRCRAEWQLAEPSLRFVRATSVASQSNGVLTNEIRFTRSAALSNTPEPRSKVGWPRPFRPESWMAPSVPVRSFHSCGRRIASSWNPRPTAGRSSRSCCSISVWLSLGTVGLIVGQAFSRPCRFKDACVFSNPGRLEACPTKNRDKSPSRVQVDGFSVPAVEPP